MNWREVDWRGTLRALPTFPDELPVLDPEAVPADPFELFARWLSNAITSGARQPNTMAVTTVADGVPRSRTLIVKDIDHRGLHFSSSVATRKGEDLRAHPVASMLFFWRESGRQVEITGAVSELPADECARDWLERPNYNGRPNPDWRVWALDPDRFEFLQATHDRQHVRVEYLRAEADSWRHRRLRPSERVDET